MRDAFITLPDWRERCHVVCDLHGYGSFDEPNGTRRDEVVAIAENVASVISAEAPKPVID